MKKSMIHVICLLALSWVLTYPCATQWKQALGGSTFLGENWVLSFSAEGNTLYAGTEFHQIFRSTDGGGTWSLMSDTVSLWSAWSMAVLDTYLFTAVNSGVLRSTNNGGNWTEVKQGIWGWALAARPASRSDTSEYLFLGTPDSGAFRSTDYGASWAAIDSGLNSREVRSVLVSGSTVFAGTSRGVCRSTNNGLAWTASSNGMWALTGIWALATGGGYVFAGDNNYGVYRSPDGGTTWSNESYGLTDSHITALLAFGQNVIAGTIQGGVWLSTNSGASWTDVSDGLPELHTWSLFLKGNYVFIGTENYGIWRRSLNELNIVEKWRIASLPVRVTDPRATTIFPEAASGPFSYDGTTYHSVDTIVNGLGYWVHVSGDSITSPGGIPIMRDSIGVQPGWNLVGSIDTTIGVSSVMSIPGGLVTSEFWAYDSGYVVADSIRPGSGYWVKVSEAGQLILSTASSIAAGNLIKIIPKGETPPQVPGKEEFEMRRMPTQFSVLQNYPNPFNPTTVIPYGLPQASRLTIKIFNVLGQTIATLEEGERAAGYHTVEWNAANAASGIYFCRLEATSLEEPGKIFAETKKLLLIR